MRSISITKLTREEAIETLKGRMEDLDNPLDMLLEIMENGFKEKPWQQMSNRELEAELDTDFYKHEIT